MPTRTSNEELFDLNVQHAIAIERLKRGFARELIPLIDQADENIRKILVSTLDNMGRGFNTVTTKRLQNMLRTLGEARSDVLKDFQLATTNRLEAFGIDELDWQNNSIRAVLPFDPQLTRPKAKALRERVRGVPFALGVDRSAPLNTWFVNLSRNDRLFLNQTILHGIAQGHQLSTIVKAVMGRKGSFSASKAAATRLVRTALNHTTNQAREVFWSENSDGISGLRWTAVLDSRTSIICSSRDGTIYPIGRGPRPPAHPNCRSIMTPVVDGEAMLGNRPFVLGEEMTVTRFRQMARDRAGETRWRNMDRAARNRATDRARAAWAAENIGSVPAETTYQQFLRRQSAAFQDGVLGPTKGALFRRGKLSLDEFVDETGRTLTLEELQEENRALWKRLKLPPPPQVA
jgi:SPP1 gp7 family putative phage head morphogenesis protein